MRTDLSPTAKATMIDTTDFVARLRPSLSQGRLEEAMEYVRQRWTRPQVIAALRDRSADVRKVAALALSLLGDWTAIKPLAVALHDKDAMVPSVAEHALWMIWFRLGKRHAVELVKNGNAHMHHGNLESAIEKFAEAIQEDGEYAEAYNQRAMAYYLSERYEDSILDLRATLVRMPQHFGAMAGMGHCYAHLGQWREARRRYWLALAIHPGLEGIKTSLEQVEQLLRDNPML